MIADTDQTTTTTPTITPITTPTLLPPGPSGRFASIPAMMRDLPDFLMQLRSKYGPIVRWQTGPLTWYLVADAEAVEQVLVKDAASYRKGSLQGWVADPILRGGLVSAEGDIWRRSRRLMQPAFHQRMLTSYGDTISEYAIQMVAAWQPEQQFDIYAAMKQITLEIISEIMFGAPEVAGNLGQLFDDIQVEIAHRLALPLPIGIPTPSNLRLRRAIGQVDQVTYQLMQERSAWSGDSQHHDLLSILLDIRDDEGRPVSAEQVRDEMVTFFVAGHETSAAVLTWALYLLAQHPDAEEKLHNELDAELAGRQPTVADLPNLTFTQQVISEAMRLYPPALQMSREALRDTELGGYLVKRGTQLLISQGVTHRDLRYFAEPEKFNPDRWTEGFKKALPKCAYFPFGGGPRICIGNQLAIMETTLILATIAQCLRVHLVKPGQLLRLILAPTLRPRDPLMVRLEARSENMN